MELFFEIKLDSGAKYKAKGDDSFSLKPGDWCVIRREFYLDYGQVLKVYHEVPRETEADQDNQEQQPPAPVQHQCPHQQAHGQHGVHDAGADKKSTEIPRIQRKATVVDQGKANENTVRSKSAIRTSLQYIERLNLPMKLINAHYSFDAKLITIQFSSEGRVDFRELVKQLSHALNTRIELRQIGVRDETAIIGGISVCGRPMCCSSFLREFASINVKMAKEQDLSLTPSTISGMCGRLKCCLKYEHDGYLELERKMPRRGDCCECKEGRGRIVDRNLLTQKVVVQLDETSRNVVCDKEEVNVVYPEKYKIQGQGTAQQPSGHSDLPEDLSKLED